MKNLLYLIFVLSNISLYSMQPNYHVIVSTADQQEYTLPRWKVRESNTLYTTFLEKLQECPDILPVCIAAPTISHNELHAYSTALDQKNFDNYYKYTLTPDQQRMLTNAIGEHVRNDKDELIPKLYDVAMSMKILSLMLNKEMLIKEIDLLYHPIMCIHNYFRRSTIIANAKEKKYTHSPKLDYSNDYFRNYNHQMSYYWTLPNSIEHPNGATKFNGVTYSANTLWTQTDGSQWDVDQWCDIKNYSTDTNYNYVVTPTKPHGIECDPSKINVWYHAPEKKEILLTQIIHTPETPIVFSKNSPYLAIHSSDDTINKVSVYSLKLTQDNTLVHQNPLWTHCFSGLLDNLAFGYTSPFLAGTINNVLHFWNTDSGELITKLLCSEYTISSLCFNEDDSRLAVASDNDQHEIITLYDCSDLSNPTIISSLELPCPSNLLEFHFEEGVLLVGAPDHALIVDENSGNIIMQTHKETVPDPNEFHAIFPLLIPMLKLLATNFTTNTPNACNLKLWDIETGNHLATLIDNKSQMYGVGTKPGLSCLYSTFIPDLITKKTYLYDQKDLSNIFNTVNALLKELTPFQLYCLYRIDDANIQSTKCFPIHRQSLLYKGIKSIPQNVKDVMYNIFHILHAYGSKSSQ